MRTGKIAPAKYRFNKRALSKIHVVTIITRNPGHINNKTQKFQVFLQNNPTPHLPKAYHKKKLENPANFCYNCSEVHYQLNRVGRAVAPHLF